MIDKREAIGGFGCPWCGKRIRLVQRETYSGTKLDNYYIEFHVMIIHVHKDNGPSFDMETDCPIGGADVESIKEVVCKTDG